MKHKDKKTYRIEKSAQKAIRAIYGKKIYNQMRVKQLLQILSQ